MDGGLHVKVTTILEQNAKTSLLADADIDKSRIIEFINRYHATNKYKTI